MIKRALLLVILIFLFLIAPSLPSQAQDGITCISSAEASFPQAIAFNLEAESSSKITKIVLEYRVDRLLSCASVTSVVFPDFVPDTSVEVSWSWEMIKTGGLPPGTEVRYRWVIADAAGQRLETPWQTLSFDDDRYSWMSLSSGNVEIRWHEGSQSFAQELMTAALDALYRLEGDTGATLEEDVRIYIYASPYELQNAMIYPYEWTGGVAFTQYGVIALGISPYDLEWGKGAIAHEIAHLVIHQVTFNCYSGLPTWLDEGLAMRAEGGLSSYYSLLLEEAILEDRLFSVRSLSGSFPAGAEEASLCYAQSYSLVDFLIDHYGRDRMLELLMVFSEGSSYDDALEEVYGFDMDGLDALWRESIGAQAPPIPLFALPLGIGGIGHIIDTLVESIP